MLNCQQFSELKKSCQRSRTETENPASHKRGKKTDESPFVAKEWELVRLTKRNQTQIHSEALIQNYQMLLESHVARKVLNFLPESIREVPAAESSQEMQILIIL